MQQVYVVHYHEIALKGRNRPMFLRQLQENICRATGLEKGSVRIVSGRLIVQPIKAELFHAQSSALENALSRVFGVSSFSPALPTAAAYPQIEELTKTLILSSMGVLSKFNTFAIRATRGDKKFSMTSKDLEVKLGDFVRKEFGKKVDLEKPDVTFYVEVFSTESKLSFFQPKLSFERGGAVVYTQRILGPGGLPVGTQPKVAVMLSGGIDSPVAAYRIMKRGASLVAIHFHSYPFTSRASIDKVKELAKILEQYHGGQPIPLCLVPLAEAQKAVVQNCEERYRVLLYRRLMVRIAQEIACKDNVQALVTGESLGQVASQTVENMRVVEAVATLPVFRPLIGYDKEEIIAEAKRIGTFEISIQPHDDCCSLFMPKQVTTRARLTDVEREEQNLKIEELVELCLHSTLLEHP